jgi:predicted phage baseplate assembly protein
MNGALDASLRGLNDCGCCEGLTSETPAQAKNRPGLATIARRLGSHSQFKASMLAALSDAGQPALRALTTREGDDFSIALIDAWAAVADVLAFYQERSANEFYTRTATERLSILHLARLIGYELRPGVAASASLAFMLEEAPGAPLKTTIDAGAKVQSIPGPGEKPQMFETIEKIEARREWNAIRPRLTKRHPIDGETKDPLYFAGLASGLKAGDGLLLSPEGGTPVFRQIAKVTQEPEQQRTKVDLEPLSANPGSNSPSPASSNAPKNKKISSADLQAESITKNFAIADFFANQKATLPPPPGVLVFRSRAAIFGHNAPKWHSLPISQRVGELHPMTQQLVLGAYSVPSAWVEYLTEDGIVNVTLENYPGEDPGSANVYLDRTYPEIVKTSWVVLKDGANTVLYQVQDTAELSKADFALTAKVTRLTLDKPDDFEKFAIRTTTVFAQSEELPLARLPIDAPVSGTLIELDDLVELFVGQTVIICGELKDNLGVRACEQATIAKANHVFTETERFTQITLDALENAYVRKTVTIYANIAPATHGETVQDVLGSGDASQRFQRFTLRQPPLTYISAKTPSGAESTLQVRVNDLLWHEAPAFFGRGPQERVFITRRSDDGQTTVEFGGGARLPTGQENVRATYRRGIGVQGLVKADQLSLLMTRPLGVKGVTNPLPSDGADDPESLADARENAPLTVLTLDRVVSLQDYEDFAGAFAGIGKALATWTWNGRTRAVFVTVAGPNGADVSADSNENLLGAMQKAGDPHVALVVASYRKALFRIVASVKIDANYLPEKVLVAVEQTLRVAFSFEARGFGQPVAMSEIIAAIHAVPGVVAVDVNALHRSLKPAALNDRLIAELPQTGAKGSAQSAELLTLDPGPLELGVQV